MVFLDRNTVVSDLAFVIYGAEPWVFALVQSRMHMAWLGAVSGRMKSDYRYSNTLVYNTFPVPALSDENRLSLTQRVLDLLSAREQYSDMTLADLYDPRRMPASLDHAHAALDGLVDGLYGSGGFRSDEERLELLFSMYEEQLDAADTVVTLA
jgi:hypothetical protein